MKKLLWIGCLILSSWAQAQTATEPTLEETMQWLNKKLANGIQVGRAEFVEKSCGLCFYTRSGVTGTCVHLANIDPELITAQDNGSGGRGFTVVAKKGLHAATWTNRNGVATNEDKYYFQFRPEANDPTFDADMIAALKRLIARCQH